MKNISNASESFSQFKKRMKNELINKPKMQEQIFGYASCMKKPIQEHTILFKSNNGSSMEGDPKAIFDYIFQDEKYAKYHFIWVVKNKNIKKIYEEKYIKNRRVHFVDMKSYEYLQYLAVSKYLISDARLPVWFIRRKKQVYIQTDTRLVSLKKGYTQTENSSNTTRMQVKDFLSSNILLSPSTYYTENIFGKDFKLSNIYEGRVVETISPRHQVIQNLNQYDAKRECEYFGLNSSKKQVLLILGKPVLFDERVRFCKQLGQLVSSEYQVCVKVTSSEFTEMNKQMKNTDVLVLKNIVDMNTWLAAADYLVGDGVGYTFDFLATGRMIMFTDLYGICKGQVFSEKELPGPTAHVPEDVVYYLENESEFQKKFSENYLSFVERYIFSGAKDDWKTIFAGGEISTDIGGKFIQDKEKLLIIAPLAKLMSEDSQHWYLNFYQFLAQLDYDKYDVTVVSNRPETYQEEANIERRMDKRIRFLYRTGYLVLAEEKYIEYKYLAKNLFNADDINKVLSFLDKEECKKDWIRICGHVSFDSAIYFGPPLAGFYILLDCLEVKEKKIQDTLKVSEKKKNGTIIYQDMIYNINETIVFEDGQLEMIISKK